VFTLLRQEDVRHFKDMLRKADNTFVKDHRLAKGALEVVRDDVDSALDSMAQQLAAEQQQQFAGGAAAGGPAAVAAVLQALEGGPAAATAAAAGQGKQKQEQQAGEGQQQQRQGKALKRRRLAGVPEFNLLAAQG
jgi:ATP-dependent RNA helicase DDX51/DBP6